MGEDQAVAGLQAILARPEYQVTPAPAWWEQLLAPVWNLITDLLERFIQTAADAASGQAGPYGVVVLAVSGLLIAGVGAYLVRAVRLSVARDSRAAAASLAERREQSARVWQTAQQLAAAGRWSEAVRLAYLSALYALDERALLQVESSLTNREHARQLSQLHPEVGPAFAEVVERYDRLRYGQSLVTQLRFEELSELVSRVRSVSLGRSGG